MVAVRFVAPVMVPASQVERTVVRQVTVRGVRYNTDPDSRKPWLMMNSHVGPSDWRRRYHWRRRRMWKLIWSTTKTTRIVTITIVAKLRYWKARR